MKVLHVITSLYTGGAERLMVELLPLLNKSGDCQVDLLLINGVETTFKKEIINSGINVFQLSMTNDVYHPRNLLRMRKYLSRYDIVHTHNTAPQLFAVIARMFSKSKAKMVTTEHNSTNRRRVKSWFKPIDRWMYNQYDAIICISDQTRENLERYIGKKETLSTIYNGVDISRLIRPIKQIEGQDEFVITMVSAYREQKDHETLLKAMTHLPDNYRLWLVGGGEKIDRDRVRKICENQGVQQRVDFLGVRNDVPEILEKSDIIVLSSHWEGLSLSSIEGMASGRPFIASDVDGLREMVSEAGVLFPHGDDKELAKSIQHLCEHPDEYRLVAERCQQKSRQYDISIMADKYLELYKRL